MCPPPNHPCGQSRGQADGLQLTRSPGSSGSFAQLQGAVFKYLSEMDAGEPVSTVADDSGPFGTKVNVYSGSPSIWEEDSQPH